MEYSDQLVINIYDAMRYLTHIVANIEQEDYLLKPSFQVMKDKSFEFYYQISKRKEPNRPLILVTAILETLPYGYSLETISKNIEITYDGLIAMLSQSCYQYPCIYKFCELLEEYDDLGRERLSDEDWNQMYNITIEYENDMERMNENSKYHIQERALQKQKLYH